MPFPLPLAVAIYVTIWWIVLFAVLPLGVRSAEEAGEDLPEGSDPGAPVAPQLAKKAAITTAIATLIFALVAFGANYIGRWGRFDRDNVVSPAGQGRLLNR
jgi:predicted secreted protein